MWKLLEQAAKTATANASEYVSTVQEKAQSLAASVQEEAATLLHAIGSAQIGPVDELLYEEVEDYKVFCEAFKVDSHTEEISKILEKNDGIRSLHEQMVPEHLAYEEFWSRYFFRREQEQLREQRETEHERQQREQEEAKAAAKAVLEEFQVDEEDEEEFDATSSSHATDDARDDLDDAPKGAADKEEDEATLAQLKEIRTSRKAAAQWKQKASEYQKQLGVLAARHEDEMQKMKESSESQYQSLCERYESKMMEMTMQIDDARAVGYNEGIQESEAIVATMREDTDIQINRLQMEIAQLQQQGSTGSGAETTAGASTAELDRLVEALTLKEQVVTALEDQKVDLEQALKEKNAALQKALAQLVQGGEHPNSSAPVDNEELKKETELWKLRALKMKKLKEQAEAEIQQLKEQSPPSVESSGTEVSELKARLAELTLQNETLSAQVTAAFTRGAQQAESQLHARIDEISATLATTQEKLAAVAKEEYQRGAAAAQKEVESQLHQLRKEVMTASQEGETKAATAFKSEIDQLRAELASLKAERQVAAASALPPAGDVFAQADAILSSLDSSTSASVDTTELLDGTWAVGDDATTTTNAAAQIPADWGEW